MMEVDSPDVNFLKDESPRVGKIKQDLQLYELQVGNELFLSGGEKLTPHHVTKNSNTENFPIPHNQPEIQVHSQIVNSDNEVSLLVQDNGSGFLDNEGCSPLREFDSLSCHRE